MIFRQDGSLVDFLTMLNKTLISNGTVALLKILKLEFLDPTLCEQPETALQLIDEISINVKIAQVAVIVRFVHNKNGLCALSRALVSLQNHSALIQCS